MYIRGWYLVDVVPCLGGGLYVRHLPVLRALAARVQRHAPLVRQVRLVAHQQERNVLVIFHPQDLFPDNGDTYIFKISHPPAVCDLRYRVI